MTFAPAAPSKPTSGVLRGRAAVGFFALLAMLMLAGAQKQITGNTLDPDLFWHLRVAEQLMRDGIGPLVDEISFASSKRPWTPYSWLAELALERIWRAGGLRAAVAAGAGLIAAVIGLLGCACYQARRAADGDQQRGNGDPAGADDPASGLLPVLLATGVGTMLCLQYLTLRPVTVAFLIIAACIALLFRDRRLGERSLAVWFVPPLVALGINLHFFTGFVAMYLWCLLAGGVWEISRSDDPQVRPERVRRCRRYAMLTAAAGIGCAATPMALGMFRTIRFYAAADPMVAAGKIMEFAPFYRGPMGIVCAAMVCFIFIVVMAGRRRVRAGEVLGLLLATLLIFKFGRFLPLFALAGAPLLAAALPRMSGRLLEHPAVWLIGCVALGIGGYRILTGLPRAGEADSVWLNRLPGKKGYPAEAADFVLANVTPRSRRVINEFGWGGYLSWRLAGKYQVLVDGRTQLFPTAVWEATDLGPVSKLTELIASSDADVAILSKTRQAKRYEDALNQLGWRVAYEDARSRVLLPPAIHRTQSTPKTSTSATAAHWPEGTLVHVTRK
ncbi:MAG: hypothetical protein ABIP55_07105 [Tepidisphaeraceae bacterium]